MANATSKNANKHSAKVKDSPKVPHTFERLSAAISALPKDLKL